MFATLLLCHPDRFTFRALDIDMEIQEIASALTTFERLRISNNHSVESIFKAVNQRGTETLPVRMFAANLSMYFNMDVKKAEAISRLFDVRQQEEICVQDIKKALKKHSPSTSASPPPARSLQATVKSAKTSAKPAGATKAQPLLPPPSK